MIQANSSIIQVTVFTDRAIVVRAAKLQLTGGDHTIVFDNMPLQTDANSLRLNAGKGVVLNDIQLKKIFLENIPDETKKQLFDEVQLLTDEIAVIDQTIQRIEKERMFVEGIVQKVIDHDSEKTVQTEMDPEKWMRMVEFYTRKLETTDRQLREEKLNKRALENKLTKLKNTINQNGQTENKSKNIVEVKLTATQDVDLTLNLSYMVYGPGWTPVYDFRVQSENKILTLVYNALIKQNTGENWNGVKLRLSTARPQIGGTMPELRAWHIQQYFEPEMVGCVDEEEVYDKKRYEAPKKKAVMAAKLDMLLDDNVPAPVVEASVETGATAATFVIQNIADIPSDNTTHKVTILIRDFQTTFKYSATPKLSAFAYLKAQTKNNTDFPFLPGKTSVFIDNDFVSQSTLKLIVPGEEFLTYLGIDEAIKIEYKQLKNVSKEEGLFSKKRKLVYEYAIEITNNRKTPEEISVFDQVPVSDTESIVVELTEPKIKENTAALSKNAYNIIEWNLSLKPAEKQIIPLKFAVECPRDMKINGLD